MSPRKFENANISSSVVTNEMSQPPMLMFWRFLQPQNWRFIVVTADVSHAPISWEKRISLEPLYDSNIWLMSVTLLTSHLDRSALNADACENMYVMPVTADTCHLRPAEPLLPQGAVASAPAMLHLPGGGAGSVGAS